MECPHGRCSVCVVLAGSGHACDRGSSGCRIFPTSGRGACRWLAFREMGRLFAMSHPLPSPQEQTVSGSVLMTETSGHHWAGPTAMLAALLGALSATLLPALPSSLLLTGIMSLAGLALFSSRMRLPAIALLAFCWLCLQAGWGMDARLPSELEGADLTIDGRVDGLVWPEARRQRFDFIVGPFGASVHYDCLPKAQDLRVKRQSA